MIAQGSDVQSKDVTEPGVVSFKVPLKPGTTPVFELQRGAPVLRVQSRTPIRTSIALQDWMYHGGGGTACP